MQETQHTLHHTQEQLKEAHEKQQRDDSLLRAASEGNAEQVHRVLELGANINTMGPGVRAPTYPSLSLSLSFCFCALSVSLSFMQLLLFYPSVD